MPALDTGIVHSRAMQLAALERLKTTGGPLETPTLILLKTQIAVDENTTVAAIVAAEADFTGYADKDALVFGTPYVNSDGEAVMKAPSADFIASGSAITNSIWGYAILNAGKTAWYAARVWDEPVVINEANDGVTIEPTVTWVEN